MEDKTLFNEIQPMCINVAKYGDFNSVKILDSFIDKLLMKENTSTEWISSLDYLKEYISFPLILQLKKETFGKGRQNLLEAILSCLKKILNVSHDIGWKFFSDAFTLLFKHLSSYEDPAKLGSINEECKLEALLCVKSLCKALDSQCCLQICVESFRPQLGHSIFICLQIAEKERNRNLKVVALETIQAIGHKDQNLMDASTRNEYSLTFSNFLPGITMGATKIATSDEIQGHKVQVAALQCWEYYVVMVVRDQFLLLYAEELGTSKTYSSLLQKLCPTHNRKTEVKDLKKMAQKKFHIAPPDEDVMAENISKLKSVTIDIDWITKTTNHLTTLMKTLASLVTHSHSKVRLTLINCAKNIMFQCSRSLSKCLIICLEILVAMSSDPVEEVCIEAKDPLKFYKQNKSYEDMVNLSYLLEERIFHIVSRIPTLIKTQSDEKSLTSLRQVFGFLEFLGKAGVSIFLQTPIHLQRMLRSLLTIFTYDISDSELLLERMISEDPLEIMSVKRELGSSFRYFQSRLIFNCASHICHILGSQKNLILVVDHCLELAQESLVHRNEAYLVLSLIMNGAGQSVGELNLKLEEKEMIVKSIFDVIFDNLKLFDVPLSVSQTKSEFSHSNTTFDALLPFQQTKTSVSVELAKLNVILVSNLLMVTGYCALFMNKQFNMFLNRMLCSILEKAGDSNVLVSHSATLALGLISAACQYSSISELIEASVPLFWFDLSQKLKRLPQYPSAPLVLKFALKCNEKNIAPFVEDLVEDVLDSLDSFHSEACNPLLTVLFVYVDSLVAKKKSNVERKEKCPLSEMNKKETLLQFIFKLDEDEKILEENLKSQNENDAKETEKLLAEEGFGEFCEQIMKEGETDDIIQDDHQPKKEIPKHIQLLVQILERCSFLLFVKDRRSQLIILDIIRASSYILDDWEDEQLPAYHKIWKPLVLRLKDNDYVVLLKALEVCVLLVKTSGTFLRKRFLQELFPSIILFLQSQSHASLNQLPKSGYYLTPAFKAQIHTLENLPGLIKSLELSVLETIDLLEVVILYLDDRQPYSLVELAIQTLSVIKDNHPDLLWFTFSLLKGEFMIESPSAMLPPMMFKGRKLKHVHADVWKIYEDLS